MIAKAPRDFAFVPQRTTGSRSDDRKFINTHLSRLAAERRKRGKPRVQTLSPARSPPVKSNISFQIKRQPEPQSNKNNASNTPQTHSRLPSDLETGADGTVPENVTASRKQGSISKSSQREASEKIAVENSPLPSDPDFIPRSPSSSSSSYDPFQTALIPMDQTTGVLLNFSIDVFRPWVDGMERGQDKAAAYSNKFYQSTWDSFQDKTTGYATLARLATVASKLMHNSAVGTVAVELKTKAYESLRHQLSNHSTGQDLQLLTQMFSLLSMEVAGRNLEAASVHAKTLQRLVQRRPPDTIAVNDYLIRSILWHECVRGSFSLGRPVFDIDHLVDHSKLRDRLLSIGNDLRSMYLMPDTRTSGFQHCELPQDILDLVTDLRFMSDLSYALRQVPSMINAEVMSAFTFRATSISSNLLALFNDAQDALGDALANHKPSLYRTGAVCLAARFWYRCVTSHELIDFEVRQGFQVFQVYGTQGPILQKLREAFDYCQQTGTIQTHPRLWLWILYVGTLAERANIEPRLYFEGQVGSFFEQQFTALALSMECCSWDAVDNVLSSFLYSSEVGPLSRSFFELHVGASPKG